ncbi:hypothetical protein SAMN04488103_1188 [Gemmobacter aquatilis]|uniref:Hemolysin-type calcium-binding repeat-containing protein n=1 Tax=Gemmobacter aquatilis TaxID=933059 RepID=A0A1H8NBB2_9RHOB|nr:hypothetical protein [Gemmobacter aquatilis]SEO26808.1 hypothetical protein SAMN04488103_1188 [Gemmobacter aquatilis]
MAISAAEQYAIELINRARLDPAAEAAAYRIGLNEGLAAGTITAAPKQALAPMEVLGDSAESHASWILSADIFSHTGRGGSDAGDRMVDAGYPTFYLKTDVWGENLSLMSYRGFTLAQLIEEHHKAVMNSALHRAEMLLTNLRVVGVAEMQGVFTQNRTNYDVSVEVQNFAYSAKTAYVTGVVYDDKDGDNFYSIGEGRAGLAMRILNGIEGESLNAGGYALAAEAGTTVTAIFGRGPLASKVEVDLSAGNVKVDLVDGTLLRVSGNVSLISGIANASALGIADIALTGSEVANVLTGNSGANRLSGGGGNDRLVGAGGDDVIRGDAGGDNLLGGGGNDDLDGGLGNDILNGGGGRDKLTGGGGADDFVFALGGSRIRIADFDAASGDMLQLDDALWTGTLTARQVIDKFGTVNDAGILLDFGDGDAIQLSGLTKLAALAAAIEIF